MNIVYNIQALRAVAALSVMLFHFHYKLLNSEQFSWLSSLFAGGGDGVSLLFVISGFIMIVSTHNKMGIEDALYFAKSRAIRIIPTYYIALIICFLCYGAMSNFHYPDKIKEFIDAATFRLNTPLNPPFINVDTPFGIRWTLNYEIYFYIVFALCIITKRKLLALLSWGSAIVLINYLPTIGTSANFNDVNFKNAYANFVTSPIILQFLIGALAGKIYLSTSNTDNKKPSKIIVSLVLIIATSIFVRLNNSLLGFISTGVVYAVILLTASKLDVKIKGLNIIYIIGDASFMLYMTHKSVGELVFKSMSKSNLGLAFLIASIASVAVAIILYYYVEKPITRKLKNTSWTGSTSLKA